LGEAASLKSRLGSGSVENGNKLVLVLVVVLGIPGVWPSNYPNKIVAG